MKKKIKLLLGAALACASLQVNAAGNQIPLPANFSLLAFSGGALDPLTAVSGPLLGSIIPASAPVFKLVSTLSIPGFVVINGLTRPLTGPGGVLPSAMSKLPGLPSP